MSKTIRQYRYYGDDNDNNQPKSLTKERMYINNSSNVFTSESIIQDLGKITHLGVQGIPGVKLYINDNLGPIIIGGTGVFELDITDYSFIYSLTVDPESAIMIEQNPNGYLIIDAIYDTEV